MRPGLVGLPGPSSPTRANGNIAQSVLLSSIIAAPILRHNLRTMLLYETLSRKTPRIVARQLYREDVRRSGFLVKAPEARHSRNGLRNCY